MMNKEVFISHIVDSHLFFVSCFFIVVIAQFSPVLYVVSEGETASLRVFLNQTAERDVVVFFNTVDGSAICM